MENSSLSNLTNDYSQISKFTDDDLSIINESNLDQQLQANNRLMNIMFSALDSLSQQNFDEAITIFQKGISYFENNNNLKNTSYNISLFYCNIALCYFYKNDLEKVRESLESASQSLDLQNNLKNEFYRLLYLKILANFLVLKIKTQDFQTIEQIINLLQVFIDSEKNSNKKANYISHVIYQLFKRDSFQVGRFNVQQDINKLSNETFDEEFQDNKEKASEYLFDALKHYQKQEENTMCLIVIRHLMEILKDNKENYTKLKQYFQELSETEQNSLQIEELFKDFDQKMTLVKSLVQILKKYESSNLDQIEKNLEDGDEQLNIKIIKMSLLASLSQGKKMLQLSEYNHVQKTRITQSLNYIQRTLSLIENENSRVFIQNLSQHQYVKNQRRQFILSMCNISKCIYIIGCREIFNKILTVANQNKQADFLTKKTPNLQFNIPKNLVKQVQSIEENIQIQSLISQRAKAAVLRGDRLVKINLTSGGVLKKYFKIIGNNQIRWAKKEMYLTNTSNCHSFMLSEIKGIIYGKCTRAFQKRSREKFEPWLCFSIIFKRRPLDIYCTEDQIDDWYIGLTEMCKLQNKSCLGLRKGQYYWRKMAALIKFAVMMKIPKKQRLKMKKGITFAKAIILYDQFRQNVFNN